ncbi:MAG: hypothetical protein NVV57_01655 [Demequina sp.]|nr:hypothetical protein [Demequina sp.]
MKVWWLAAGVAVSVIGVALAVAVALPGDLVFPDGPTSSPVPSMTTRNFLNPAFGWRGAIIVLAAVATMVVIALVARTVEHHRNRYSSQ